MTLTERRGDYGRWILCFFVFLLAFICRKNVKLSMNPIVHEDWFVPKDHSNDIALLKLAEYVDLKTYTPACLPAANRSFVNKIGSAYGKTTIQVL